MVRQTHVDAPRFQTAASDPPFTTVEEVRHHFSELAYDVITLGELQVRLLVHDVKETGRRATVGIVFLMAMTAILLGSVPVLLLGLGELLVQLAGWNRAGSYLLIAALAAIGAVVAGLYTVRKLKKAGASLNRSSSELQSNLAFVKSLFRKPDAPSNSTVAS